MIKGPIFNVVVFHDVAGKRTPNMTGLKQFIQGGEFNNGTATIANRLVIVTSTAESAEQAQLQEMLINDWLKS